MAFDFVIFRHTPCLYIISKDEGKEEMKNEIRLRLKHLLSLFVRYCLNGMLLAAVTLSGGLKCNLIIGTYVSNLKRGSFILHC